MSIRVSIWTIRSGSRHRTLNLSRLSGTSTVLKNWSTTLPASAAFSSAVFVARSRIVLPGICGRQVNSSSHNLNEIGSASEKSGVPKSLNLAIRYLRLHPCVRYLLCNYALVNYNIFHVFSCKKEQTYHVFIAILRAVVKYGFGLVPGCMTALLCTITPLLPLNLRSLGGVATITCGRVPVW